VPVPPRPAIDAFLEIFRHQLRVVHRGYQICVQKIPRPASRIKQIVASPDPPNSASPVPNDLP
jgi:hypothetical protein